MTDPDSAEEWVLRQVEDRTEPVGYCDHCQGVKSDLWTSVRRLSREAKKPKCPYTEDEIEAAVSALEEDDRVVKFHGLLAPATEEHMLSIIECESEAGVTRQILVGQINEMRSNASERKEAEAQ